MRIKRSLENILKRPLSGLRMAATLVITILGLFSLYFSALILPLPPGIRILLDSSTVASVAMDFSFSFVVALLMAKIAWTVGYLLLIYSIVRLRTRKGVGRKSTHLFIRILRFSEKHQVAVNFLTVVVLMSIILVGPMLGVVHLAITAFLLLPVLGYYSDLASLREGEPLQISRSELNRAFLILVYALSISCFGLAIFKSISSATKVVRVETSSGVEDRALLMRTSDGLILGPISDGTPFERLPLDSYIFVPFSEIERIEVDLVK